MGLAEAGIYETIDGRESFIKDTVKFLEQVDQIDKNQIETLTWCYLNNNAAIALNYTNELARKYLIEGKIGLVLPLYERY